MKKVEHKPAREIPQIFITKGSNIMRHNRREKDVSSSTFLMFTTEFLWSQRLPDVELRWVKHWASLSPLFGHLPQASCNIPGPFQTRTQQAGAV